MPLITWQCILENPIKREQAPNAALDGTVIQLAISAA